MKKVLIVEDDVNFRTIIKSELERYGYEVLEAANGKQGLDVLSKDAVDLILLDILMPEMSGTVFAYEVKNQLRLTTPIVILTNLSSASYQDFVSDLMVKSNVSLDQIVEVVKKYTQ